MYFANMTLRIFKSTHGTVSSGWCQPKATSTNATYLCVLVTVSFLQYPPASQQDLALLKALAEKPGNRLP